MCVPSLPPAGSLDAFVSAVGDRPLSRVFWTAPSPGTLAGFCEDRYFGPANYAAFVDALADAVRPEYEAIAARGVMLQIDCPDLAMGRHTRFSEASDHEFGHVLALNVAAMNKALVNVDQAQVRVHVCWGNYAGPHHRDIAASFVWPHIAMLKAKYFLVEAGNARHAHEHAQDAARCLSANQVLVPGVIDTKSAYVEHPDLIADRLLKYAGLLGPARVMAATDCGFASTSKSTAITSDVAWRKLAALVEGANRATFRYVNAHAPAESPELFAPTPFRVFLVDGGANVGVAAMPLLEAALRERCERGTNTGTTVVAAPGATGGALVGALRWVSVDAPVCIVGVGAAGLLAAREVKAQLEADASVARRRLHVVGVGGVTDAEDAAADEVTLRLLPRDAADAAAVADVVHARATAPMRVDKRSLVPLPARSSGYALAAQPDDYVAAGGNGTASSEVLAPPADVDVIVVGAGVLGLLAAAKLVTRGYSVAVLDQRNVVGGIWSMYANSASQVNSSEGGYCIKDVIVELASAVGDEETAETTRKAPANRDHSTASEVLRDIRTLAHLLGDRVRCGVSVRKIMPRGGGASDSNGVGKLHTVVSQTVLPDGEARGATHISSCRGVVVAINDRVGVPRAARFPGTDDFDGVVASGTADQLVGTQWRDKRVVIVGMGAFAIENARTALEGGAAHVTIVCRRHGTVCPKIVDYLNFVKARVGGVITIQTSRGFFSQPYDAEWRHDTLSNVKQMRQWAALYRASGATQPECWPKKHTHEGHTISVSDIWFVAHHLGKLATHVAEIATLEPGGARLTDGAFVPADVVCSCIGFERNTGLCERLTGFNRVKGTNYLAPQMMYLADAEINGGAFNFFFGSSVLEMAKFYVSVFVAGLDNPAALGPDLWGPAVPDVALSRRKWGDYIDAARHLTRHAPIMKAAKAQVAQRTAHFWRTLPPEAYVASNAAEWEDLHRRLNGGVPVPKKHQLPYFFDDAAAWCGDARE